MAITFPAQTPPTVQSNATTQSSWQTSSITFPTTGQNVLGVLAINVSGTTSAETFSCSDSLGNTWNIAINHDQALGNGQHSAICYFSYPSGASDTTCTVTVSWNNAVNERFGACFYVIGHNHASPLNATGSAGGNTSATSVAPVTSANLDTNDQLVVVAWGAQNNNTGPTTWPTTGYTSLVQGQDATRSRIGGAEYKILTGGTGSGATQSTTISYTTGSAPTSVIATFRPFSGAAPANTTPPAVTGTATLGNTLTTDNGTWTNSPTSYTYQWQRSSNSGSTWVNVGAGTAEGGATANTHTVVGFDVGCLVRCQVTAVNASGSAQQASNSVGDIPVPSGPSARLVALPVAQSDGQSHIINLTGPVLPNETIVLLASTSVGTISGDMMSVTDPNGNTYTLDHDTGPGPGVGGITQAFSAQNGASKLNIGASLTNQIKQAHVVGAHAIDSPTITLDIDPGWDKTNVVNLVIGVGGPNFNYQGVSGTTLQNVTSHGALSNGQLILYHGQSPYYAVYALNPGDGTSTRLTLDGSSAQHATTGTPNAGTLVTTKQKGVAFTLVRSGSNTDANNWLTPGTGWTADWSGYPANHWSLNSLPKDSQDAFGIAYGGESQYKIGVQKMTWSSVGSSIVGQLTTDGGAATFQDTMVIAYGFTPAGGGGGGGTTVFPGGLGRTIEQVSISATGAADIGLGLSATVDVYVHLVGLFLTFSSAGTIQILGTGGGSNISGVMAVPANGILCIMAHQDEPIASSSRATSLQLEWTGAGTISGWARLYYSIDRYR